MAKQIQSVETVDGVTTITYDDGSTETQGGAVTIEADEIKGGISFG